MLNDAGSYREKSFAMSNSPPASSNIASTPTSNDETASTVTHNAKAAPNFPTKTDKPRPHVCATCSRGFARLEHLKRHERSHTKEKPFECPECSRSFARRDLLLRHQQKLHQTSAPSSRPRRRESTSSVAPAGARARKNSIVGASAAATAAAAMRPRANTISHVDGQAMQHLMTTMTNPAAAARMPAPHSHSRHPSLAGLPMHNNIDLNHYAGMSTVMGQRGMAAGLKLETNSMHGLDFAGNLRTAPLFSPDFDFDFFGPPTSATINPSALQYTESPGALDVSSPFHGLHELQPTTSHFEDSFDWLNGNFDQHMSFNSSNENAIDGSSPSAISTTSQSGVSDPMVDGSNHSAVTAAASSSVWQPSIMGPPQMNFLGNVNVDAGFPDLLNGGAVSPQPTSQKPLGDAFFSTPPPSLSSTSMSPSLMSGLSTQNLNQAMNFPTGPETPTSMNGNNKSP